MLEHLTETKTGNNSHETLTVNYFLKEFDLKCLTG